VIPVEHLGACIEIAQGASTLVPLRPAEDNAGNEVGGKIVVCQRGSIHVAKSNEMVECAEKTSGVEIAARTRYAIC
jgi:hypothetical protein